MQNARRLMVPLDGVERSALAELAQRERRDPRQQAAFLIRRGLELAGMLPVDTNANRQRQDGQREQTGERERKDPTKHTFLLDANGRRARWRARTPPGTSGTP